MMGLGIVCFPDAPLRLQGEVSVGKSGEVHSQEAYRRFKLWELTFIGTGSLFALTALVGFAVNLKRTREQRKSGETA